MFHPRLLLFTLVLATGGLFGQTADDEPETNIDTLRETITVTALRDDTPLDQVGSAITVIDRQQIEASGQVFAAELLRDVPGVDLVQVGGAGKQTSAFIRGANSTHTLVLIDGVEMQDPISAGNNYDLAHLSLDNVERIEIVRGPQSTLYGSDAMSGVIHIITRKYSGTSGGRFSGETGSYGTARGNLDYRTGTDSLSFALAGGYYETDGYSVAREGLGNSEEDGYRNTTLSANLDARLSESWNLGARARLTDSEGDIDNTGGAGGDDPNHISAATERALSLFASHEQGIWRQRIGVALTDHERETNNPVDPDHPSSSSESEYQGDKLKIDWQHNLRLGGGHHLTLGAETEEETGSSRFASVSSFGPFVDIFPEEQARTTGLYIQDHVVLGERASLTLGGRYDDHDRFGSEVTWRGAFVTRLNERGTSLKGSWGTGFKAPSLYQLFSSFGNEGLAPETSTGWDVGLQQTVESANLDLSLTWFDNSFEELIDFDGATSSFNNISEAETSGLEFGLAWFPSAKTRVHLDYTHTDTKDLSTGERLYRRPEQKASLRVGHTFSARADMWVSLRHVGERDFQDFVTFPATRVTLDSFTTLNLAGSVTVWQDLRLTARLENITDEDYEEVLGYGTAGASGYLGLRLDY